jgi:glycine cleavage system aminomethyltransferase T
VPIEYADLGTELTVRSNIGQTPARVVERPFIDPKKQTPKTDLRRQTAKSY